MQFAVLWALNGLKTHTATHCRSVGLQASTALSRGLQNFQHQILRRFPLTDLLQLKARTPPKQGVAGRWLKMWGRRCRDFGRGFGVFPYIKGKINVHCIYIWLTGVAGGRAVPPDVREEPEGLYTSTLHRLLPSWILSYPVRVYRLTCIQCLYHVLVMGGNGLSRPGGNLGFRV